MNRKEVQQKLDAKSEKILSYLYQEGPKTTSQIRKQIGIENRELHYRYDKLRELGLIETGQVETPNARIDPLQAELTYTGKQEIKKGLLGAGIFGEEENTVEVPQDYLESLEDRVERLENKVNTLVHADSS